MTHVFVINSGSSSLKYKLYSMPHETVLCSGLVDRIGKSGSRITHKVFRAGSEQKIDTEVEIPDHKAGLARVAALVTDAAVGVLGSLDEVSVVGHRVVHGGEAFAQTTVITAHVKEAIKGLFSLAPLHNPQNYLGVEIAEQIFPNATQVAVFDTALHQSMPEHAYRYAIPKRFYEENKIRAYGFHGTSHKYVYERASEYVGKVGSCKAITAHLGNGCSISAIDSGRCIDTSMGFGPMNGLVMGTRAGDIDQSVIFYLIESLGYSATEVSKLLNYESGMLGLTGFSDLREVRAAVERGDRDAALAYDIYTYRIKKYIGAYAAALGGLDVVVFTGGVGENDARTRRHSTSGLQHLGIVVDLDLNKAVQGGTISEISTPQSRVKVLVVPTDEEAEIARQSYELLAK